MREVLELFSPLAKAKKNIILSQKKTAILFPPKELANFRFGVLKTILKGMMKVKKSIKNMIAGALSLTLAFSAINCFAEKSNDAESTSAPKSNTTVYNGDSITPDISVMDSGVQLVKGTDYDLTYEDNVNVGTATITATFKGNYSGIRKINFNIIAKTLSTDDVTFTTIDDLTFTGSPLTPEPTIKFGETVLEKDKDYTLSYEDNTDVGTGKVKVTFTGNYTGTAETDFEIIPDILTQDKVKIANIDNKTFTGSEITPEPEVKYGSVVLVKDKDYEFTYKNNINVGTADITITFKGNYGGNAATTFEVVPDVLSQEKVNFSTIENKTYTGKEIKPEPTITYNSVTLEKDKDYTLSYENNVNVGQATVKVTFIGNYSGDASTAFEIISRVITDDDTTIVVSPIADQTYTGKEIKPEPVITDTTR